MEMHRNKQAKQVVCQLSPGPLHIGVQMIFQERWPDKVSIRIWDGKQEIHHDLPTDVLIVIAQLSMKAAIARMGEIETLSGMMP